MDLATNDHERIFTRVKKWHKNQFQKTLKNHKRLRTISYIFKQDGKTKVHG